MKHLSAGIVVLFDNRILLVRQKNDMEGCHLSIPKGLIGKNEKPIEAAIRETYEETGLVIQKSRLGKPYLMIYRVRKLFSANHILCGPVI